MCTHATRTYTTAKGINADNFKITEYIHIHTYIHTYMYTQATRTYTTEKGINADNFTMTEYVVDPYAKPLRFTEQRDEYRESVCLSVCMSFCV